jgi:hypothetical protein
LLDSGYETIDFGTRFFTALASAVNAQRCGSGMSVVFLDRHGKPVEKGGEYQAELTLVDDRKPAPSASATGARTSNTFFPDRLRRSPRAIRGHAQRRKDDFENPPRSDGHRFLDRSAEI